MTGHYELIEAQEERVQDSRIYGLHEMIVYRRDREGFYKVVVGVGYSCRKGGGTVAPRRGSYRSQGNLKIIRRLANAKTVYTNTGTRVSTLEIRARGSAW